MNCVTSLLGSVDIFQANMFKFVVSELSDDSNFLCFQFKSFNSNIVSI